MTQGKGRKERMSSRDKIDSQSMRYDTSMLTDDDIFLFNEGSHYRLYEKLGAHLTMVDGVEGTYFAVWAPNAKQVSVIGEFNDWDKSGKLKKLEYKWLWVWAICKQCFHAKPDYIFFIF